MMESEKVIIQSPTSFVGSYRRIWKLTDLGPSWARALTIPLAIVLVAIAWVFVAAWTIVFGLLIIPWRLLRRGSRKRRQERLRHEELIAATSSDEGR